jgi:DNA mismatch endonuclease (patch repair protein)
MADVFSKRKRSQVMAAIRSKGNKDTEQKLVSILRLHGIKGWRRHPALPGKPDFVFHRERQAVFVDGCFWHGCKKHARLPKSNVAYWRAKLERNAMRDRRNTRLLRKRGWKVLRFWEHALSQEIRVAERIKDGLATNRIKR